MTKLLNTIPLCGLFATFMAAAPAWASGTAEVLAAFVLVGQSQSGGTVPMARVVLDGADAACPGLILADGSNMTFPMSPRTNPAPSRTFRCFVTPWWLRSRPSASCRIDRGSPDESLCTS